MERNLCVTLVICQESLRDARSTKCKSVWDVDWIHLRTGTSDGLLFNTAMNFQKLQGEEFHV